MRDIKEYNEYKWCGITQAPIVELEREQRSLGEV
jgi:hypothetical protein